MDDIEKAEKPKVEKKKSVTFIEWLKHNKWSVIVTLISLLFWGYQQYITSLKEIEQKQKEISANQKQAELETKLREVNANAIHAIETNIALKLKGCSLTAGKTEDAMLEQYQQNLDFLEHCKKVRTCQLPPTLARTLPLPNYVPVSAIYLKEEKIEKEN